MCCDNRDNYGKVDIVYGSRSKEDLRGSMRRFMTSWMDPKNGIDVHLTIDREQEGWDGHVGFVPTYVKELGFDTQQDGARVRPADHDQIHAGRR